MPSWIEVLIHIEVSIHVFPSQGLNVVHELIRRMSSSQRAQNLLVWTEYVMKGRALCVEWGYQEWGV